MNEAQNESQGVRDLLRLANAPGALLVRAAGIVVLPYLALALLAATKRPGFFTFLLAGVAILAAGVVGFFAWRRARFAALIDEAEDLGVVPVEQGELLPPGQPVTAEERRARDARLDRIFHEELTHLKPTWWPRVEAFQRAIVRAAGGPTNAPYLRDDLRVTVLAALLSTLAIPASLLGILLAFSIVVA